MQGGFKKRVTKLAAALTVMGLVGSSLAGGHSGGTSSYGIGDHSKGTMKMSLYRGVAIPYELTVVPTLDCEGEMSLKFKWDEEANRVDAWLKGKGVLEQFPDVEREEGVNFTPNPFWPELKDFEDGRYQLWLLSSARPIALYYDPVTLDFIGSEFDFEQPPSPVFIMAPTVAAVPMPFFQPDANGDVDEHWTFEYDKVPRQDNPEVWGHHHFTVAPTNLCLANPFRIDLSTVRPYLSKPVPPEDSYSFGDYIQSGMFIDITVEPAEWPTNPPLTTMVASYSGSTAFGGSVPKGWQMDLNPIFGSVAPGIVPFPGRGDGETCEPWYYERTNPVINFCQQMGQAELMEMMDEHNEMMLQTQGG